VWSAESALLLMVHSKLSAVDDQAVRPWSIGRDVCLWHKADMLNALTNVGFGGKADMDQPLLTKLDL
jgi:hypothetical protein